MARLTETKTINPKINYSEIAKELGCSSSTLQRCKQDIKMLSPHRFWSKTNKRTHKISNNELDLERPQMTLNDLKRSQLTSKKVKNENVKRLKAKSKNILKGGSVHKDIETNDKQLDESLHNKNL